MRLCWGESHWIWSIDSGESQKAAGAGGSVIHPKAPQLLDFEPACGPESLTILTSQMLPATPERDASSLLLCRGRD